LRKNLLREVISARRLLRDWSNRLKTLKIRVQMHQIDQLWRAWMLEWVVKEDQEARTTRWTSVLTKLMRTSSTFWNRK
jgi:hypothetical protein